MRKIRAYVDTSVFGGMDDEEFSVASRRFFDRIHDGEFVVLFSQLTVDELEGAPSQIQQVLKQLPADNVVFVPTGPEAIALAQAYMDANILGKSSLADALHVATATIAGADLILSWNFCKRSRPGRSGVSPLRESVLWARNLCGKRRDAAPTAAAA
jgi:hypothetical protein